MWSPGEQAPMRNLLLVTGAPGSGKTTIIRKAADRVTGAGGFFTEEIREEGQRLGFRMVTLSGQTGVLAAVDMRSRFRVGKYGVDIAALESVGVAALETAITSSRFIVVDEIGKMEILSDKFKSAVLKAIESGKPVLATIMLAPHPWADAIKARPGTTLLEVTRANREKVWQEVERLLPGQERLIHG